MANRFDPSVTSSLDVQDTDILFESGTPTSIGSLAGSKNKIDSNHLSKIWRIDKERARRTLRITEQLLKQESEGAMDRNFGTNDRLLRYKQIDTHFFTDTFYVGEKMKSARGFKCVQLFVSDKGFIYVVPMVS